jgi:hypothetical protein
MWRWRLLGTALVWPCQVGMRFRVIQDAAQMPPIDDEPVVKALMLNTAYPALGEGVGIGCLEGRQQYLAPVGCEHRIKRADELGVVDRNREAFG